MLVTIRTALVIISLLALSACETQNVGDAPWDDRPSVYSITVEPVEGSDLRGGQQAKITVRHNSFTPPYRYTLNFSDAVTPATLDILQDGEFTWPYWEIEPLITYVTFDNFASPPQKQVNLSVNVQNGTGGILLPMTASFTVLAN